MDIQDQEIIKTERRKTAKLYGEQLAARDAEIERLKILLAQVPTLCLRGLRFVYAHTPANTEHQLAVDFDNLRVRVEDELEHTS